MDSAENKYFPWKGSNGIFEENEKATDVNGVELNLYKGTYEMMGCQFNVMIKKGLDLKSESYDLLRSFHHYNAVELLDYYTDSEKRGCLENHQLVEQESSHMGLIFTRQIKNTYTRRKKSVSSVQELIFGTNYPGESTTRDRKRKEIENSDRVLRSHKQNKTPFTEENLRRSARGKAKNKGAKATTAEAVQANKHRGKGTKKIQSHAQLSDKLNIPGFNLTIEFPGLETLEEMDGAYPEIPVNEIQNVAINRCGLAPSAVTTELLLLDKAVDGEDGRRSINPRVSNE